MPGFIAVAVENTIYISNKLEMYEMYVYTCIFEIFEIYVDTYISRYICFYIRRLACRIPGFIAAAVAITICISYIFEIYEMYVYTCISETFEMYVYTYISGYTYIYTHNLAKKDTWIHSSSRRHHHVARDCLCVYIYMNIILILML